MYIKLLVCLQLMRLQKEAEIYTTEVADHDERIHNMSQHLKNVKQELTHNLVRFDLAHYILHLFAVSSSYIHNV